jgi:Protein of unknown function (DUF1479)
MLSEEQVSTFLRDGVLVVPQVLSHEEVLAAHQGLSATLLRLGRVDTSNLTTTGHGLTNLSSTQGSGGVLDIFYEPWQCHIATHATLWQITTELWQAAATAGWYKNNYKNNHQEEEEEEEESLPSNDSAIFQHGYCYLDRIGYRIPTDLATQLGMELELLKLELELQEEGQVTQKKKKKKKSVAIQRCLTPHLDCCPETFHDPPQSKWRPIQCFVSLVDTLQPNQGGLEAALGFHHDFDTWSRSRPPTVNNNITRHTTAKKQQHPKNNKDQQQHPNNNKGQQQRHVITTTTTTTAPLQLCLGEYTHIRPKEDADVMQRIQHVPNVTAGSAVFFDHRIPHANSYCHDGHEPRSVVYCSFLPNVFINRRYARHQLDKFHRNIYPNDQWIRQQRTTTTTTTTTSNANNSNTNNNNSIDNNGSDKNPRDPTKDGKDRDEELKDTDENDIQDNYNGGQQSKPLPEWLASSPLARKLMAIDPW